MANSRHVFTIEQDTNGMFVIWDDKLGLMTAGDTHAGALREMADLLESPDVREEAAAAAPPREKEGGNG